MLNNIEFRVCNGENITEIENIEQTCFATDAWSHDFITYALGIFLVIGLFDEGKMIGYGACHNRSRFIYIDNLAILPSYRNKGFGTLFMRYFFRIAIENNCTEALLQVNVNNSSAIAMYKKMGFKTVRLLKGYYRRRNGRDEDALLMNAKIMHDLD